MQRFLLVRGKPGIPVSNPHTQFDPMRFVGQRVKCAHDPEKHDSLMDCYEVCEELIADHSDLVKPIARGELVLVDKVGARTAVAAQEHFAKKRTPVVRSAKGAE